jgi:hypothetical protein
MIFTPVPVTPFTVVVKVLTLEALETPVTMLTEEPVTPFTVVVRLFGEVTVLETVVALPSKPERLTEDDTPFTVLTRLLPDVLRALLLMMFTPVPVTPFTVVVKVLTLEALETPVTMLTEEPVTPFTVVVRLFGEVTVLETVVALPSKPERLTEDDTPFTVLTKLLPDVLRALLLMMFTPVPVTPLTVVVKVLTLEALLTVVLPFSKLETLTDEDTPLTFEVNCPEATLKLLVVFPLKSVGMLTEDDTPFTELTKLLPDVLRALLLMMFTPVPVTPFTVVVKVLTLELLETVVLLFNSVGMLSEEETPFTVLTKLLPDVLKALPLMIFTPVPVTPLTVVVRVLTLDTFDTVTGSEEALTQVGAAPDPAELRTCPLVPAAPAGINAPEKRTLPVTSSLSAGEVFAIPTLPVLLGLKIKFPVVELNVRLLAPCVTVRAPVSVPLAV